MAVTELKPTTTSPTAPTAPAAGMVGRVVPTARKRAAIRRSELDAWREYEYLRGDEFQLDELKKFFASKPQVIAARLLEIARTVKSAKDAWDAGADAGLATGEASDEFNPTVDTRGDAPAPGCADPATSAEKEITVGVRGPHHTAVNMSPTHTRDPEHMQTRQHRDGTSPVPFPGLDPLGAAGTSARRWRPSARCLSRSRRRSRRGRTSWATRRRPRSSGCRRATCPSRTASRGPSSRSRSAGREPSPRAWARTRGATAAPPSSRRSLRSRWRLPRSARFTRRSRTRGGRSRLRCSGRTRCRCSRRTTSASWSRGAPSRRGGRWAAASTTATSVRWSTGWRARCSTSSTTRRRRGTATGSRRRSTSSASSERRSCCQSTRAGACS